MYKHLPRHNFKYLHSFFILYNIAATIATDLLRSAYMSASAKEHHRKEAEVPRKSKIKVLSFEQMLANITTTQEELAKMFGEINTSPQKPKPDSTQENQRKEVNIPPKSKMSFDQISANVTTTHQELATNFGEIDIFAPKSKPDSTQKSQRKEGEVPRKLKPKAQNIDQMMANTSRTQQELATNFGEIDIFAPEPKPYSTQENQRKEDEVPRKSRNKALNFDQMLANISTTQQELVTKLGVIDLSPLKPTPDSVAKAYDKELYYCIKSQASLSGISYYLQSKYDGLDKFRTFHPFPNLPDEIHVMIFEYMMPERNLVVERINEFDAGIRHVTQGELVQVKRNQWEWKKYRCTWSEYEWGMSKQYKNPQSYLEDRERANLPDIFKAQKHEIPALLQVCRKIRYELLKPDRGHYTRIFASASCPGMLVNFGRDTLDLFTHNPIWHRSDPTPAGYDDTLKWWGKLERARTKTWLEGENNGCATKKKGAKRGAPADGRIWWEVVNPGLEEKRAKINSETEALKAARNKEIKEWMNDMVNKARRGVSTEVGTVNHKLLEHQAQLELLEDASK